MFERFMAVLVFVLILVVIFIVGKLREYYREKKIKELVSWIEVYDAPYSHCSHGHDMPLWMYIHNAQIKLNTQKEHRICNEEEWKFVKEIIQEFQNDLMQSYFKGNLGVPKSKYYITKEYYFMYRLERFLEGHLRDHEFLGYDMETYNCNSDYSLTEFSVAYYKLYYVVYLFCKNCKPLNESGMRYSDKVLLEWIEKKIQTERKEETNAM